jgi:hypothetical protein
MGNASGLSRRWYNKYYEREVSRYRYCTYKVYTVWVLGSEKWRRPGDCKKRHKQPALTEVPWLRPD